MENIEIIFETPEVILEFPATQWPAWPTWANGWAFEFYQATPLDSWTITHNLGYNPNVSVIDTWWSMLLGVWVTYTSTNILVLNFAGWTTWTAYLS